MDSLGDRMKAYETEGHKIDKFERSDIIIARLDGRSFSKFTKSLKNNGPFHEGFASCMKETSKYLIERYNPVVCYTQSDEITLIFINTEKGEHPFGGKAFKLQSILAADTSVKFYSLIPQYIPERTGIIVNFDCRTFKVPDLNQAMDCLKWREKDGFRNAVGAIAREYYSSKQLLNKKRKDQLAMIKEKGIDIYQLYDKHYLFGTFYKRSRVHQKLTPEELSILPSKHQAHKNPDLEYVRNVISEVSFSDLNLQ